MDEKDRINIKKKAIKKGIDFVKKHPKTIALGVVSALSKVDDVSNKIQTEVKFKRQKWGEEHPGLAYKGEKVEAICDIKLPNGMHYQKGTTFEVLGYNDDYTEYMFNLPVEYYDDGLATISNIPLFGGMGTNVKRYEYLCYPVSYFKLLSTDDIE